jgi:DNA polymerase III gamma/tau subunit
MAAQAGRNDLVGAMNTFEIIEQQFPGSRGYVEATGTALRVTAALKQAAAQRLAALPKENADREHGVKAAAGLDQIQLRKELELEKKNNATALAEAKARGQKWPPFLRRSEDGLKAIAKLADETEKRLVAFDRAKAVQSLDLAEQARADLDNNEIAAAEAKVKEATSLWSKNEIATRVAKNIEEARAAAKEAPAPAATPEPTPAAKATPKPAAKLRATPVGTASSESASAASSSGTKSASVEEEKPPTNWLFIAVAGTLLVVLAFVAWRAYTRVRKKANEIIA